MKPILFNGDMVRAILDGRKTVTRRVIKPRYRDDEYGFSIITNAHTGEFIRVEKNNEDGGTFFEDGDRWVKPPYQPSDILYVRETYCDRWMPDGFLKDEHRYGYKDDGEPNWGCWGKCQKTKADKQNTWIPSIHMPKEAARIFLRVTDVRVERLQEIHVGDAIKEGAWGGGIPSLPFSLLKQEHPTAPCNAVASFAHLWDSTIPKKDIDAYGWDANPFVWVIEFEKVSNLDT